MDKLLALSSDELKKIPAVRPPPGIIPDLANPGRDGSNARETIIGLYIITGLTVIVLLTRLYTNFVVLKKHGWEDYTAVLATIGAIAYAALGIYIVNHGVGVHQWNVPIWTFLQLNNWLYAITYVYGPSMLLVTSFFLSIFLCIPGGTGLIRCGVKVAEVNVFMGGFNIFADMYLLILPFSMIWILRMGLRRKISLLLVFLVGILACVSSILGLVYRLKQHISPDAAWYLSPEYILVTFELDATIMVSCFLVLPALFRSKYPLSFSGMWSNRSHIFNPISWIAPRDQLSNISSHGSGSSVTTKHSIESDKTPFGKTTPYRGTNSSQSV